MPRRAIIVTIERSPEDELIELAQIMIGLRRTTKNWQDHFGSVRRDLMNDWEKKADNWLARHVKFKNADF